MHYSICERVLFCEPCASHFFLRSAFYWGRSAAELPAHVIFGATAGIVTYFMFGLRSGASHVGIYILVTTLTTVCGATLLLLVGALSKNMAMGNGLATLIITVVALTNGQFARGLPAALRWIKDISFSRLSLSAALVNELQNIALTDGADPASCLPDGNALLLELGLGSATVPDIWEWCAWMLFQSAVFRVLAYFALHFMYTGQSFKERWRLLLGC
jgi:hypothetical protein